MLLKQEKGVIVREKEREYADVQMPTAMRHAWCRCAKFNPLGPSEMAG
jgi:hypothetical protein